jgi:hypothetical protein
MNRISGGQGSHQFFPIDVVNNIHAVVRNTDNIDVFITNGIENQAHSFRKAVITCFNGVRKRDEISVGKSLQLSVQ